MRRTTGRDAGVEARLREAIASLRPLLPLEVDVIELAEYRAAAGVALLRVRGECPDCELTAADLLQGITAHIRMRVPEVREVVAVGADTDSRSHE